MDPCHFVRLIVESLALKLPPLSKPGGPVVHPSTTPCFCVIQLQDTSFSPPQTQTAPLPLASPDTAPLYSAGASPPIIFSLDPLTVHRLTGKLAGLTVSVYAGRTGRTCGFSSGRLLGRVRVAVDLSLESEAVRPAVMKSGWVSVVGSSGRSTARLHLVVRSEPDPRFVFQFGGEPECSPVVFQIGGGASCLTTSGCIRQPAFSCRFSADRRRSNGSSTSCLPSETSTSTSRLKSIRLPRFLTSRRDLQREQRKGWTVTIHDLSGSPVAAASMITPFVPSPGSDRVSRSNPGSWLILHPASPSSTNWMPWGRLQAWRERGSADAALGLRFDLIVDSGPTTSSDVPIAESSISLKKGGEFRIDGGDAAKGRVFVMGSTVEGEGRVSRPVVQVAAQHVVCMGDAALFVALAAAVDLSMDACQLFSTKLRKELSYHQQENSF